MPLLMLSSSCTALVCFFSPTISYILLDAFSFCLAFFATIFILLFTDFLHSICVRSSPSEHPSLFIQQRGYLREILSNLSPSCRFRPEAPRRKYPNGAYPLWAGPVVQFSADREHENIRDGDRYGQIL